MSGTDAHASTGRPAATPGASGVQNPGGRSAGFIGMLALVTGVQALSTFTVLALPTLATRAGPAFGLGPEAVGYQISLVYIAAASLSGVAGLVVRRYGAAFTSLIALSFSALGLLGVASGNLVLAILASLVIGMGYGLTNPAASHLLLRFAPKQRQNLIFAVKQTGVPIGGVVAALMLPPLAERSNWQVAMVAGIGLIVAIAIPLALSRSRLDDDRSPGARLSAGPLAGLSLVLAQPLLRAYAIMGFAYASFQFCLFAFLVTMLVQDFHWSLVAAGGMASLMQIGGAAGRIAWSMLADRIGRGAQILLAIGICSAAAAITIGLAGPSWPAWLLTMVLFVFGFCLVGWNGLWMAEIARISGPQQVGLATGGVLSFTFSGIVLGPAAFASVYKLLGAYTWTYGVFSLIALMGAGVLWRELRRQAKA